MRETSQEKLIRWWKHPFYGWVIKRFLADIFSDGDAEKTMGEILTPEGRIYLLKEGRP